MKRIIFFNLKNFHKLNYKLFDTGPSCLPAQYTFPYRPHRFDPRMKERHSPAVDRLAAASGGTDNHKPGVEVVDIVGTVLGMEGH
jgi:hypothetical protein